MALTLFAILLSVALFFGMLLFFDIGRKVGERERAEHPGMAKGAGPAEAATFALLGLLIAFTYSSAASRFDRRRDLIVDEANAIGTAWLRIDLLPEPAQPAVRGLFRKYLDARLASYRDILGLAAHDARVESERLKIEIWRHATQALRPTTDPAVKTLTLQSLNDMFDLETLRVRALHTHAPTTVFGLLLVASLMCAAFAGYGTAGNPSSRWLQVIGFAAFTTVTIYAIVDLEFPRFGLIRVDSADQALLDVRAGMEDTSSNAP